MRNIAIKLYGIYLLKSDFQKKFKKLKILTIHIKGLLGKIYELDNFDIAL